jgi:hypothetical protein
LKKKYEDYDEKLKNHFTFVSEKFSKIGQEMTSLYFVFVNVVLYEIYREKAEVTINYVVKSYKEEVNAKQNV